MKVAVFHGSLHITYGDAFMVLTEPEEVDDFRCDSETRNEIKRALGNRPNITARDRQILFAISQGKETDKRDALRLAKLERLGFLRDDTKLTLWGWAEIR